MREEFVDPIARDDADVRADSELRPRRLADFVGQGELKQHLSIVLEAARQRNEAADHLLLAGPPGLGKTTMATIVANEMGAKLHVTSGPALERAGDLAAILTKLEDRDVLFIDEVHRLSRVVEEILYPAMEDFQIDIVVGKGPAASSIRLTLPRFTLIGATTRAGLLSGPLRDRFPIRETLGFYGTPELTEILRRNAAKLGVVLEDDAASELAKRSRGTPRIANNHLLWVRDFATSKANGRITMAVVEAALKMSGTDQLGLGKQDRRYLETLIRVFAGGPAGIEAIAHTMNAALDTLEDEIEPFLLRSEMLVRTPRGRMATTKAYEHLQIKSPATEAQSRLFS